MRAYVLRRCSKLQAEVSTEPLAARVGQAGAAGAHTEVSMQLAGTCKSISWFTWLIQLVKLHRR